MGVKFRELHVPTFPTTTIQFSHAETLPNPVSPIEVFEVIALPAVEVPIDVGI